MIGFIYYFSSVFFFPRLYGLFLCLHSCFGGRVSEGYGMTETSCVISSMEEGDNLSGHVGSPNPACGELWTLLGQ